MCPVTRFRLKQRANSCEICSWNVKLDLAKLRSYITAPEIISVLI